jgi:hypothetical protein
MAACFLSHMAIHMSYHRVHMQTSILSSKQELEFAFAFDLD